MSVASSPFDRTEAPVFADGLGERMVAADGATGELLQILRLRPALTAVPSFEFAVRERTARLTNFRHAYYARVRRVDRLQGTGTLALVSDHVEGTRLSEILRVAHARRLQLDTNAALCLIRQLVPAVALLHENARDASHGLIAPERLIVTPHARLVIVEHVAGSAIEQLQFGRERLWQELRVAVPSSAGVARFDHRADVNGIGITALSLVLGRPIGADEFPHAIPGLLMQAGERSPLGDERPLSNPFRNWLARALQLDVRRAFASAPEALAALEDTLASDSGYIAAPVSLEAFLSQYLAAVAQPAGVPRTPAIAPPAAAVVSPPPSRVAPPAVPVAPVQAATGGPGASSAPQAAPPRASSDGSTTLQALPTIAELIPVGDLRIDRHREAAPPDAPVAPAAIPTRAARASLPAPQADRGPEPDETLEPVGQQAPARRPRQSRMLVAAAAVIAISGVGLFGARFYTGSGETALGTLVVQSSPPGVEVFVDGVSRGMTPTNISVVAGSHILELRGRGVPRVIPLHVPAGGQVSQYLEFADTPMTGMLVVHSQPAGATVLVDGVPRGVAPLTIDGLEPGDHEVLLQSDAGNSRHVVTVLAGTTASLVAPAAAAAEGPVSGWISVKAPFTIEIRQDGRLIGTSETDRVMLAAGRQVLELSNETLGYRQSRVIQVVPGKVATVALDLPRGTVNLNASPWAEVWIDGQRVGETPIGNLELPIGSHEIVFRHPQFGEKRHAVSVTTAAPVRLSVEMN